MFGMLKNKYQWRLSNIADVKIYISKVIANKPLIYSEPIIGVSIITISPPAFQCIDATRTI